MLQSVWPLGRLEIVQNGRVIASERAAKGAKALKVAAKARIDASGWIAARCSGWEKHPGGYVAAHSSPVYFKVGATRAFDGPAAEHMLGLVEGGMEYLKTISTAFDEASRKRMVKLFKEAQQELKGRLLVEGGAGHHHHGAGAYHTHGHSAATDHQH